jgi:hypothetical protein
MLITRLWSCGNSCATLQQAHCTRSQRDPSESASDAARRHFQLCRGVSLCCSHVNKWKSKLHDALPWCVVGRLSCSLLGLSALLVFRDCSRSAAVHECVVKSTHTIVVFRPSCQSDRVARKGCHLSACRRGRSAAHRAATLLRAQVRPFTHKL